MAINAVTVPAVSASAESARPVGRPLGALIRLFVGLTLLASVAAMMPVGASASAAQMERPLVGQLVTGYGPPSRVGPIPANANGISNPDPTRQQVQPELMRAQGGVSYQATTLPDVYFTFDDGPDHVGVTDRILDLLDEYNAKATFFVVGRAAEAFPNQIRRIVDEGHSLGNHTYSHPRLTGLSDNEVRRELTRANDLLADLSGSSIHCYRPPEAKVNERVHAIAVELGLGNESWSARWGGHWGLWDVDSWDWRGGEQRTLDALNTVSEGDVVLMHSLRDFSADIFQEWMEDNHHRFDFDVLPGCMEALES